MAEEETGFTFVDRRRTAVLNLSPEPDAVPEPASLETAPGAEAALPSDSGLPSEAEAAPTTYDLLGYCINLLAGQAWQKLGLLADPQTGEAAPNFPEAKVAIDAVGDLAARLDAAPESVIPADLRRELRTLINDLRLNYVSQSGPAA